MKYLPKIILGIVLLWFAMGAQATLQYSDQYDGGYSGQNSYEPSSPSYGGGSNYDNLWTYDGGSRGGSSYGDSQDGLYGENWLKEPYHDPEYCLLQGHQHDKIIEVPEPSTLLLLGLGLLGISLKMRKP